MRPLITDHQQRKARKDRWKGEAIPGVEVEEESANDLQPCNEASIWWRARTGFRCIRLFCLCVT